MYTLDIVSTIKIIVIMIVAFLVITAWDEVLEHLYVQIFGTNLKSIWAWISIASIATVLFFIILLSFEIDADDLYGLGDLEI